MMLLPFPASYMPLTTTETNNEPANEPRPIDTSSTEQRPARCSELCAVCGDQSTGYHYEVPSCNGCKTFFRRTIVSERVFKCHKDGNCRFTKDIRCACRCCRFKKCLEVGMNPKAIQSSRTDAAPKEGSPAVSVSPDPVTRKRTYDISSLLDMAPSCSTSSNGCSEPRSLNVSRSVSPVDTPILFKSKYEEREMISRVDSLLSVDEKLETLRRSNAPTPTSLLDVLTRPCALEQMEKYEPSFTHHIEGGLSVDRETFLIIEYVKQFTWFKDLGFADKYALLCDRIPFLLALRLASKKNNVEDEQIRTVVQSCTDVINRLDCDRSTLVMINMLVLLDCDSFTLLTETKEMLMKEKRPYIDCLAAHLFQKFQPSGAARTAEHFSLMWTVLRVSSQLKSILAQILPTTGLTRQLMDINSSS